MKIEIEKVNNGYIIIMPKQEYEEIDIRKKFVVQEKEDNPDEDVIEFQTFVELVDMLQDIFEIYNSKHNKIGLINGLCSEDKRWDIQQLMKESLKNPKNDLGD